MRDLISSDPSNRPSRGEPNVDLANCGVLDLTDLACGDADRIGRSAVVADMDGVGEAVSILDPTSSGSILGEESRRSSGYLELDATRGMPGEKDGGGLTGGASPGDVMDTEWIPRRS